MMIELVAIGGSAKPTVAKFKTLGSLGARVVYLALDADPAGEASTTAACRCAWHAGLDVAILPSGPGHAHHGRVTGPGPGRRHDCQEGRGEIAA